MALAVKYCISANKAILAAGCMKKNYLLLKKPGKPLLSLVSIPTVCALNGGEDYELIFTIKQDDYDKLVLNEEFSVIGYMAVLKKDANF